jgi:stearoyl-CoA desaturase (delta-9 desaturase)
MTAVVKSAPGLETPGRALALADGPAIAPNGGAAEGPPYPFALRSSLPFMLFHLVPLAAIWTGVTTRALVLFGVAYVVRMFCITAGYHRYFAHRAFRTGRIFQFLLALGGLMATQKGPLWWAAHHRRHHRESDTARDVHSPKHGIVWSHVGWVVSSEFGPTDFDSIRDFAKYGELRWLNKHDWVGPWSLGVLCFLVGGWSGLVVGFFASTIALWHATFMVNSVAHLVGRRRYDTGDTSRNNWFVAVCTGGEGWHNNHHHYQASARQGFRWWQIDTTFYCLKVLSWFGVVRDLKGVPERVLHAGR